MRQKYGIIYVQGGEKMSQREIINAEIGARLRNARLSAHMTLDEAGERIGISGSVLRRYEIGTIKSISIDMIKKFAETYDVHAYSLLGWEPPATFKTQKSLLYSEKEQELIKKYRCLTPEGKATVDAVIDVQYEVVKPRVKNDEVI